MARYWFQGGDFTYGGDPPPSKHCIVPYNYTWVCRWCGQAWFYREVASIYGRRTPWIVWTTVCKPCGDGRVLPPLDNAEIAVVPKEVILHDLLIELDLTEHDNNQGLLSYPRPG